MDDFLGAEVPKAPLRPPSIAPPHRIPERLTQRRESNVAPPRQNWRSSRKGRHRGGKKPKSDAR